MAPGILSDLPVRSESGEGNPNANGGYLREPLKLSGALEQFQYEDTTPVIGREFLNVNIVDDLLNSPNADELLRDLAITSTPYLSVQFFGKVLTHLSSLPERRRLLPCSRQPL